MNKIQDYTLLICLLVVFTSSISFPVALEAQSTTEVLDRIAIADAVAKYSYTADARDLEGFLSLFTDDAVWKSYPAGSDEPATVLDGREAIREFSLNLYQQNAGIRTGHHQSGLLFTALTGDTASTQNMILLTRQAPGEDSPAVTVFGVYYDTWRKTPQGWRIATRTLRQQPLAPVR